MGRERSVGFLLTRRGVAIAASVVALAGLTISGGAAVAAPQPTISQVQARIKKLNLQENWLIQRYDQVSQEVTSARQRLFVINTQVSKDRAQLLSMRDEIAQIASAAYENGSLTSPAELMTSGDPQTILSQSAFLIHLSTTQQQQLDQVLTVDRELAGAKQMAQRTESAVAALKKQLTTQRAQLQKLIAQEKSLLGSLTAQQQQALVGGGGSTGGSYHGPTSTQADKAVEFAYNQLGCPYWFGGTGPCRNPGFDCSGLTQQAWAFAGVSIPRTSYQQASLPAVPTQPSLLANLEPGDILEFAGDSHVGIYVGGGYLIDAPQPGMNVEKVSLSSAWYAQNLDGAYRP